jgi:hypothetical protein
MRLGENGSPCVLSGAHLPKVFNAICVWAIALLHWASTVALAAPLWLTEDEPFIV